jgi:hypothetical protein
VQCGRGVTLFSRHRKVLNRRFFSVVQALASLGGDFALDGELVVLDHKEAFILTPTRQSIAGCYELVLRVRFTGELVVNLPLFPPAPGAGKPVYCGPDPVRQSPLLQASSGEVLDTVVQARPGRCRRQMDRFHLRTRRSIRRLDQAPHKHGARVRRRRGAATGAIAASLESKIAVANGEDQNIVFVAAPAVREK